jgi:hypothetical protein
VLVFSWTGFAIPSVTFEAIRNVTDGVDKSLFRPASFVFLAGRDLQSRPQRLKPSETLRTGLQTPSGTGSVLHPSSF